MPDNRDELDRLVDWALATYADPGPDCDLERRILNRIAIETALASYADPGPDSGLKRRILSRIAAEAVRSPRRRWLGWAVALPFAAACLLLFMLFSHPRTNHLPATRRSSVAQSPVTPSTEAANRAIARPAPAGRSEAPLHKPRVRRKTFAAKATPLPKLDIFPSLQPLSPQEQAVVDFATHATKSERESLIAAQSQANAPLRIAAIEVKPLEPPSAGAN